MIPRVSVLQGGIGGTRRIGRIARSDRSAVLPERSQDQGDGIRKGGGTGMTIEMMWTLRGMEEIEEDWKHLAAVTKNALLQYD